MEIHWRQWLYCKAAVSLLKNQTENADSLIQTVLRDQPTAAVFYEMQSEIMVQQKNYEAAHFVFAEDTSALGPNG